MRITQFKSAGGGNRLINESAKKPCKCCVGHRGECVQFYLNARNGSAEAMVPETNREERGVVGSSAVRVENGLSG